jgi:hypothetical protein
MGVIHRTDDKFYTVVVSGRWFVKASHLMEAQNIVYEALLGNDPENVLSWGEIDEQGIQIFPGTRYSNGVE